MKYQLSIILFFAAIFSINAQSAVGTWKTIDDDDGKVKSHVEIFEKNGKLYSKVLKLINPTSTTCDKCTGEKKDQPTVGMEIIWDLEKESDTEWEGGKILDPKSGKEYKCKIELTDANTLNVRGFIGFALLGRTQTWYRVE
ncbi:MAG: hypothetical protein ACJA1A_002866 [Saprospiraceae bacterium]|jgi:uncharacterized protein (DUF2147 family)|tara:strand:- start:385 stop:807 length:423 start_codon:yes stop_codon:yes gene_type:complete